MELGREVGFNNEWAHIGNKSQVGQIKDEQISSFRMQCGYGKGVGLDQKKLITIQLKNASGPTNKVHNEGLVYGATNEERKTEGNGPPKNTKKLTSNGTMALELVISKTRIEKTWRMKGL